MTRYAIYVQDADGKTHYVGERDSRSEAQASADIYNRDPLAAGTFYVRRAETLDARLKRLERYWGSTRFALTADDVRHDYKTGAHRYAYQRRARAENARRSAAGTRA